MDSILRISSPVSPELPQQNNLSWSSDNMLAVGLNQRVYIKSYDLDPPPCSVFYDCTPANTRPISMAWALPAGPKGSLAIGCQNGRTSVQSLETRKIVREYDQPQELSKEVGDVSWNSNTLACGYGDGSVYLFDVRISQNTATNSFNAHTGSHAAAGIKWRDDGRFILTGGNDNAATLWDVRMLGRPKGDEPLFKWRHKGCIKVGCSRIVLVQYANSY